MEEVKTINIPMDEFLKIIRKLSYVENADCIDYKAYHEGMASVLRKIKPFLGDVEDTPSEKYEEFIKKIFEYAHTHPDEFEKQQEEYSDEPHCQIYGCDREDEDCDECDNCYPDEYEALETKFMKLRQEFVNAFRKGEITKPERDELIFRWKDIAEDWELEFENNRW